MPRSQIDHYEILERVGEGGMGIVYRARDRRLGRTVAIKILHPDLSSDPRRRARFEREARAEAALNHPNIATFFDIGEASLDELDDVYLGDLGEAESSTATYLVMEYVEGEDLKERLVREPLSAEEIVGYGIQIAEGLASAHAANVLHRDLKPRNIRITPEGRVKILDFGLAKILEPETLVYGEDTVQQEFETSHGLVVGTAPYMSPEQIRGRAVDERSDLFALGVVLYEMATRRRPFEGGNSVETLHAILQQDPPALGDFRDDVPAEFERIIRTLLAKEPEDRHQSAEEVAEELKRLARHPDLSLSSALAILLPAARRRRWLVASGIVAALLIAAAVGLFLVMRPRAPAEPVTVTVSALENATGDPNLDYLADGFGFLLAAQLGRVPLVDVVGWTSPGPNDSGAGLGDQSDSSVGVRSEPGSEVASAATPEREEGSNGGRSRGLAPELALGGSLLEAGERIIARLELERRESGEIVWEERFVLSREELPDLFARVAARIASVLQIPLPREDRRALDAGLTESASALDDYLQAHHFLTGWESLRGRMMAIDLYQRALEKDPEFALAHAGLSEACWRVYHETGESTMAERARGAAERAVELAPGSPLTRLALARVARGHGRYAEAVAELRQVVAEQPALAEAHYELALARRELGDLDGAKASLKRVIEVRPRWWRPWNELGDIHLDLGAYDAAESAFRTADELAPEERDLQGNLLAVELIRGDYEEAIELYERLDASITEASVASNLGTAYWFQERYDRALDLYGLAAQLEPQEPDFPGNRGEVLRELGRHEEAADAYRRALTLVTQKLEKNPDSDAFRADQARYLAKLGRCEEARSAAPALGSGSGATQDIAFDVALVYALCDDRLRALSALRTAVEKGLTAGFFAREPEFEALREDPAFQRLVERAGRGSG